mgnify:CR=1 FL=1
MMTHRSSLAVLLLAGTALWMSGCDSGIGDERDQGVGYRNGTAIADNSNESDGDDEGFTSNGERGNLIITEINWAGSVTNDGVYDPDDIFIEFQNKHPRPIHLTGWQLTIEAGNNHPRMLTHHRHERGRVTYPIPLRENGLQVQPNEYIVLVKKADGAFSAVADYVVPELDIPWDFFRISLRDIDDRRMSDAGSTGQEVFAGGYDLVTVRTMERVQLLFANQGGREASWHSYSYNPWDSEHAERISNIGDDWKERTFGSPGLANSPDYSGNTSAGTTD